MAFVALPNNGISSHIAHAHTYIHHVECVLTESSSLSLWHHIMSHHHLGCP